MGRSRLFDTWLGVCAGVFALAALAVQAAPVVPAPERWLAAGGDVTVPAAGAEGLHPAIDLGLSATERGARRRWLELAETYPALEGLEPAVVEEDLWTVLRLKRLVLVGAETPRLATVCAALTARRERCAPRLVEEAELARFLRPAAVVFEPPLPEDAFSDRTAPAAERAGDAPLVWFDPAREPDDPSLTRLAAVGDIMMGTDYPSPAHLNGRIYQGATAEELLGEDLAAVLRAPDVTFGNLEGVLKTGGTTGKSCANCFAFRSPGFYAGILADAGFDALSLANNHSGDFGEAGRRATMGHLDTAGIAYAGLDRDGLRHASLRTETGKRVAFVAFAPNNGTLDIRDISRAEDLVRALERDHDVTVVSFHGGAEGRSYTRVPKRTEFQYGENRGNVHAFGRAMVRAGADFVFGHGPHVPRAVDLYRGRLIAYSLGNFWTHGLMLNWGLLGIGPVVEVWVDGEGAVSGFRIHSTRQGGLGIPTLDDLQEAHRLTLDLTRRDYPTAHRAIETALSRDALMAEDETGTDLLAQWLGP